jgi:Fe-S cluster biogenesis protein NfuA
VSQADSRSALAEKIEATIAEFRPLLRGDGGDVELVEVAGNSARVRLIGSYAGRSSSMMTLQYSLERVLRERIPGFGELIAEWVPGEIRPEGHR